MQKFRNDSQRNLGNKLGKIFVLSGLFSLVSGLSITFFWKDFTKHLIQNELRLSNISKSYDFWVKSPFPQYIDFYFFNWTNPLDFKNFGYKPKLQEIGPFRFREKIEKVDLIWNNNGTITYKKRRTWYYEPNGTKGTLDDNITTLNVVALTAARVTKFWSKWIRIPLSFMLTTSQELAVTKKVREFLFEGYADPLIDFATKIPGLSLQVPFDRFGWFYQRNGSEEFDGVFNMETGENGLDVFGKLKYWNYNNKTQFFKSPCGSVSGSAGDFWPFQRPYDRAIKLFSPDMCRYISFSYKGKQRICGFQGYRYESGSELFDNGTLDPQNTCFRKGESHPSGTLNVSNCRAGAPIFISYPHFYYADSVYSNSLLGMEPNSTKHEMYIVLEEDWGIPLEIAIRLQINILMEPDLEIRMYQGAPKIFLPVMWFEQKVTAAEDMKSEIQFALILPKIGWFASIGFYVNGFCCIFVFVYVRETKKKEINKVGSNKKKIREEHINLGKLPLARINDF